MFPGLPGHKRVTDPLLVHVQGDRSDEGRYACSNQSEGAFAPAPVVPRREDQKSSRGPRAQNRSHNKKLMDLALHTTHLHIRYQ